MPRRFRFPTTAALCLAAVPAAAQVLDGQERGTPRHAVTAVSLLAATGDSGEHPEPGRPWIGVILSTPGEQLAAHLKLPAGRGLVIENVVAGSPAAEAQLKRHDLLVAAAGKPISSVGELSDALAEAGEKRVTLEVIRGGEKISVDVTPKPAPEPPAPEPTLATVRDIDWVVRPLRTPLPADITVEITKTGDEPAKVVVKRGAGHDQWHMLPDDSLERLPADLREPIATFLGRKYDTAENWLGTATVTPYYVHPRQAPVAVPGNTLLPSPPQEVQAGPSDERLGRRLDEVLERLEAIESRLAEVPNERP